MSVVPCELRTIELSFPAGCRVRSAREEEERLDSEFAVKPTFHGLVFRYG